MRRLLFLLAALILISAAPIKGQKPELVVQLGHANRITQTVFSRDGKWVATIGGDDTIKIWELASGLQLRSLQGHRRRITSAAFSPDGKYLASGSTDDIAKLWEVATGKEIRTFSGHDDDINSVAFHPRGEILASASDDQTIRFWDANTGLVVRVLKGHGDAVNSIAFSEDGKYLVSGSDDRSVKLWESNTGRVVRTFRGHSEAVSLVAIRPDGRQIASASADNTLRLWNVADGRNEKSFSGQGAEIESLAFSPDGKNLAARGFEIGIRVWDLASGLEMAAFAGHEYGVNALAYDSSGRLMATASDDETVKIWDAIHWLLLKTLQLENNAKATAISLDGNFVATGEMFGSVAMWDVATGRKLWEVDEQGEVASLQFSPDGRVVASASWDDIILWDVLTGKQLIALDGERSVAFASDGKLLAAPHGSRLKLWEWVSGREIRSFEEEVEEDESLQKVVVFSPNDRWLVSGGSDGGIRIWDATAGKKVQLLKGHKAEIASLAFSPNGELLASASEDQTVRIWNTNTWTEMRALEDFTEEVNAVAFSRDGKSLAIAGDDRMARIIEVETGNSLGGIGEKPFGFTVAFSPDGTLLATARGDDGLLLYSTTDGKLVRTVGGEHGHPAKAGTFTQANQQVAFLTTTGKVKIWDLSAGRLAHTWPPASDTTSSIEQELEQQVERQTITSFAVDPSAKVIAEAKKAYVEGNREFRLTVREISSGKELANLTGLADEASTLVFSFDGKHLAFTTKDEKESIKLWKYSATQELKVLRGHSGEIRQLQFTPDDKFILSSSRDETTKLWEISSGRELRSWPDRLFSRAKTISADGRQLACLNFMENSGHLIQVIDLISGEPLKSLRKSERGHLPNMRHLSFSPDGRMLASSSEDGTVKLWDVSKGEEARTLSGHTGTVYFAVFDSSGRFVVSGSEDGTVRLWEAASGKFLGKLVAIGEQDWAVVSPEGLFDASPGAMQQMHWVVGTEIITIGQLKERYYEPGLLAKLLGFNSEPIRNVAVFEEVKLFPDAELQMLPATGSELQIKLRNRGGGIGRVQVFLNGKELLADARGAQEHPTASEATLGVNLQGAAIRPGEENEIRVVTWNQEGYLSSRGAVTTWKPEGNRDDSPPEFWAIVVGVSDYASPEVKLRFAAKDAEDMAHALKLGAHRLFGPDRVHITVLSSSEKISALSPTKENLRMAFEKARQAKPKDIFVVYLAGHGLALRGEKELYAFLTREARSVGTEHFSDPAIRAEQSLTSEELTEWTKQIPALKQVLILDTCAAGAAAAKLVEKRDIPADQVRALERLKDRTGFHVLMGAAADKVSYEASRFAQGLLTYALLLGMKGAALRKGEFLDVSAWFQYAADEVPQLAKNIGGVQKPLIAAKTGSSFDLGQITNVEKAAIRLTNEKPFLLRPIFLDVDESFDVLELTKEVRKRLDAESYSPRGADATMEGIYVDADELPGAIRAQGTYRITGNKVTVTLSLRRDTQRLVSTQIEGEKHDLPVLVERIVKTIHETLLTLPANK